MKSFHVGRGDTVDVPELGALLGNGRSWTLARLAGSPDDHRISLQDFVARIDDPRALAPVTEAVAAGLSDAVALVHLQVLLRQLWEAAQFPGLSGSLAQRAEAAGRDPLARATSRGSVRLVLGGAGPEHRRQRARVGLITGEGRP